jgi:hypothetical protein
MQPCASLFSPATAVPTSWEGLSVIANRFTQANLRKNYGKTKDEQSFSYFLNEEKRPVRLRV